MKYKGLLIATSIFFILVNTAYFWEARLGGFAFISFFLMIILFIVLAILLFKQILFFFKEKFGNTKRLLAIAFVLLVLLLASIFPAGIINFENFKGMIC